MKFLIIRFSSIGDIVLTTPAIRCLKQQLPDAELHFLSRGIFKDVTLHNPYIDRRFYYDNNLGELIGQLKEEQYDYVIDFQKNVRSYKIRAALKTKTLSFKKLRVQKFFLTKLGVDIMPGRHITQRCLDTLLPLGVADDGYGLDYFLDKKDRVQESDLPASHRDGYVAVVIGASYFTKKMPVIKLQQLCLLIDRPVVLIGGGEDVREGEAIAAADPEKIVNVCGRFSLNGSADLIRQSELVISHDTGMQYIACAFGKQVLAIWGGTSPLLDVEPYYGERRWAGGGAERRSGPGLRRPGPGAMHGVNGLGPDVEHPAPYTNFVVPGLRCQPCSSFGKKKCPAGHFSCMHSHDVQAIAAEAMARLALIRSSAHRSCS
ncbi:MAG TPA: glycosyltransferase family 9 protein [Puia sp.]|nr:glycosyltransferase family 9 protein [Puia sp.]